MGDRMKNIGQRILHERIESLISELPTSFRLFRASGDHYVSILKDIALYGKDAKEAAPKLAGLLEDDDPHIVSHALSALIGIDHRNSWLNGRLIKLYNAKPYGDEVRVNAARLLAMNGDKNYIVKITSELLDKWKKLPSSAFDEKIKTNELLISIGKDGFEIIVGRLYGIFDPYDGFLTPAVGTYAGEISNRLLELAESDDSLVSLFALMSIAEGGRSFNGDIARIYDIFVNVCPHRWNYDIDSGRNRPKIEAIEKIFISMPERSVEHLIRGLSSDNVPLTCSIMDLLGLIRKDAAPAFDLLTAFARGTNPLQASAAIRAMGMIAKDNDNVDLASALAPFLNDIGGARMRASLSALEQGLTNLDSAELLLPSLERILREGEGRLEAMYLVMAEDIKDRIEGGAL